MEKVKLLLIFGIILAFTFPLQLIWCLTLNDGKNGEERVSDQDPKSSAFIIEDEDDFLEGTRDNLTIDGNGNLKLDVNPINWKNMTTTGAKPSARRLHSMVYNSAHDRTILFGGQDGWAPNMYDDETWVYNLTDNTWTNMTTTGVKPNARLGHSMVYDSAHDQVVLFGGNDGPTIFDYNDDTWVYNLTDNIWTYKFILGDKPNARAFHSMVYDSAHNRAILFGGYDGSDFYDDTWVYNLTDNTWTNMTTASGDKPSARSRHAMVYDSAHNRTILFGGYDSSDFCDDTWIYNLTDNTWTEVTPAGSPSARAFHSMVYDSAHDQVVLFGGNDGPNMYDDETWIYNLTDNTWTEVTPASSPSARSFHSTIYNSADNRIILFGGYNGTDFCDDTWVSLHNTLFQQGLFTSKVKSFNSIFTITGKISWTPVEQQVGTSLKVQIGFSDTSDEADFNYMHWHTTNFTFEVINKYMKYGVLFESSDIWQIASPLLNKTIISYTLPIISSVDDDDDDDDDDKSESIPGMITSIVFLSVALSVIGIVFYSKNKAIKSME